LTIVWLGADMLAVKIRIKAFPTRTIDLSNARM